MPRDILLQAHAFEVAYGPIKAVKGVDFQVGEGELVAIVGANGAGKTSILNGVLGLAPHRGELVYAGVSLAHMPPHKRVAHGLALVPEGRGILATMSVEENLIMGAYARRRDGSFQIDREIVFDRFPILRERREVAAGLLSGGEQQMLAIGRALMGRPRLLMLDEPSLGLAPLLVGEILEIVQRLRSEGMTVLLVEQNVRQALRIADRAYLLETGRVLLEGRAAELMSSGRVIDAFLGGGNTDAPKEPRPSAVGASAQSSATAGEGC